MSYEYPELDRVIELGREQKKIYQPSSFWKKVTSDIVALIEKYGIEEFRTHKTIFSYFAPSYGRPSNSFNEKISEDISHLIQKSGTLKQQLAMEEFLSGYFHALSDYRVFSSSDIHKKAPFLHDFSESNFGNPIEQFEFYGKKYSRSALNYILGLCFLKKNIPYQENINTVMEIGGGFGTLGEVLFYTKGSKYINIDIPPVSFVSWNYLNNLYGESGVEPFIHDKDIINIEELNSCSVFNAWDIEKLHGKIDLFVNFISFQEMEPDIVENYLSHVKRLSPKYILLRNMREGKQVKQSETGHGVKTPILKDDYIDMINDSYQLLDSNVIPFGYKTVDGYHSELLLFKNINI